MNGGGLVVVDRNDEYRLLVKGLDDVRQHIQPAVLPSLVSNTTACHCCVASDCR